MDVRDVIENDLLNIRGQTQRITLHLTARLLAAQRASGDLLEIGVLAGRYLGLLGLFRRPDELLFAIDNFSLVPRPEMEANVRGVWGDLDGLEVIEAASRDVSPDQLGRLRFASVDGSHTLRDAVADLNLVDAAGGDDLIVAYDDFFNINFPGVTEGYFRWARTGNLTAFAFCRNKLMLCRPDRHAYYADLTRDFILEEAERMDLQAAPAWSRRRGDPWLRQKIGKTDAWIIR